MTNRRRKQPLGQKARSGGSGSGSAKTPPHPDNGSRSRRKSSNTRTADDADDAGRLLAAKVCAAFGFLLYTNAVAQCGFCYDDLVAIERNPDVLNVHGDGTMSSWPDVFNHDFWGTDVHSNLSHKSYRPLVIMSFRLDALLSRQPWVFHLTNALLYAATCWLVVNLLSRTVAGSSTGAGAAASNRENHRRRRQPSLMEGVLLSGLWFAAHPIHTEAVTSLVGRAEVLAAMFCLLGTSIHQTCHDDKGRRRRAGGGGLMGSWLAEAACFFAACLCKETAVMVPMVLAVAEVAAAVFGPKTVVAGSSSARTAAATVGRAAGLAAVSIVYLWFRSWLFAGTSRGQSLGSNLGVFDNFLMHLNPGDKIRTAIHIQAKYVQLMVWPDKLSCDYSLGVIEPVRGWATPEMAFAAAVVVAVAACAWRGLARLRRNGDAALLLGLGLTFGPLLPASHVVGIGTVMAERLLFLPSIGAAVVLCHFAVHAASTLPGGWKAARAVLALCTLAFAFKTVVRNPDWSESDRLHTTDLATYPKSLKLLLGMARKRGIPEDYAFRCAKVAQEVLDQHSPALTQAPYSDALRAMAQLKTHTEKWSHANLTESLQYADQVTEMGDRIGNKDWSDIHDWKGTALLKMGVSTGDQEALNGAAAAFRIAIEYDSKLKPKGRLYCLLGTTLGGLNQNVEAHRQYQECFRIEKAGTGDRPTWDERNLDRRNYAILMKSLSGYDSSDAAAAKVWGQPAVEAIEELLELPKEEGGEVKMIQEPEAKQWITVRNSIKELIARGGESDGA